MDPRDDRAYLKALQDACSRYDETPTAPRRRRSPRTRSVAVSYTHLTLPTTPYV